MWVTGGEQLWNIKPIQAKQGKTSETWNAVAQKSTFIIYIYIKELTCGIAAKQPVHAM